MAYNQFQTPMWQQPYYQPTYVQPQPQQVAQPQPQIQPQNTGFVINDFKIVSEDEAKAYIVSPNTRIMLMDRDKSLFCIKSADSLGKSAMEWFKYEKVDNLSTQPQIQEFDPKDFVKKGDIDGFVSKESLETTIKSISDTFSKKFEELNKRIKIQDIIKGENNNG